MEEAMARRLPAAALALAVALATGCGVLEELDKGRAEQEKYSPSARKAKEEKAAAATSQAGAKAAGGAADATAKARQAAATWWQNARSIGSEETSSDVVRCVIGGSEQYMHKHDCLMRGGTVAKRGSGG